MSIYPDEHTCSYAYNFEVCHKLMPASVLSGKDILQMQTLLMPKPFLGIQRG